eukprot:3461229-Rhodomonas_salina.1
MRSVSTPHCVASAQQARRMSRKAFARPMRGKTRGRHLFVRDVLAERDPFGVWPPVWRIHLLLRQGIRTLSALKRTRGVGLRSWGRVRARVQGSPGAGLNFEVTISGWTANLARQTSSYY